MKKPFQNKRKTESQTAYSYIRFSTTEQAKGDSKRRQIEAGKQWCKANGYHYSEEAFFDEAKSAHKGDHLKPGGDLQRLVALIEDGTIPSGSVLLIENFDRLSRLPTVTSLTLFLNLINAGIGLVFTLSYEKRIITSALLNKEPHLLQMVLGECIRAHAESARKSVLVKASKQQIRQRISDGAIVKHNNVPRYFSWSEKNECYEHNQLTLAVHTLVTSYLNGHSLYNIAATFNKQGIQSVKAGGNWSPRSVKSILTNRALLGEYFGNPNFFPRIIEADKFNQIQVLIAQNTTDRGKRADLVNIFKGLAYCKCGRRMNILTQSKDYRTKKKWKKVYRYLRCCSVNAGTPCNHKFCVPMQTIETEFFVHCMMADPHRLLGVNNSKELKAIRASITQHQAAINSLTDQIKKVAELVATMEIPELRAKLGLLNNERLKVRRLLDAANLDMVRVSTTPDIEDIKAILADAEKYGAGRIYDDMAFGIEQRLQTDNEMRLKLRTILPRLVSKIVVDAKTKEFEVFNHGGKSLYQSLLMNV